MADITATIRLKDEASSQFSKIGQAAQQAANKMTNVGKAIDQAFSGNRAGQFASSMSTSVGEAASTLGSFRTSIGEAAREAQSFGSSVSASISSAGSGLSGFGSSVSESMNDAKSSMDDMADSAKEVGDAVQDAGEGASGFSEIGNKASEAGEQVNSLTQKTNTLHETFSKLVQLVGGAMIAKKIKDYGEESVQAFSDYESGIAEVSTLLPDASKAEMDQLGEGAKQIALDTGAEINDVTSAMYQAISASVPQDQVLDFLRTAEKAATGGVTDMEASVDSITSVINAYGTSNLSAMEASDKMFTAVKLGKTTFDELGASLYNVVPTAVGAGVSFDDVTGALAAMTAQGVPTSVATTQLRQAIVELSDSGSNTGKKFKELAGTGFRDFIAQGNNLSDAFQIMQQEADKTGLGVNELFSSVEAGNAVLSLSGDHAQLFADDIAAMQDSSGATDTAYGKMTDTVAHRSELMKAQFEDIKLSAGEALEEGLGSAIGAIGDNIDSIKEPVVEFFHGIGDAIGNLAPMLPGLLKGITSFATNIIKFVTPILDFMSKNPDMLGTVIGGIGAGLATWKLGTMDWSQMGIVKVVTALASNPVAAGLTATAAGITAIAIAVDKYNQKQIENNLDTHFGDIALSAEEAKQAAISILNPGSSVDNPINVLTTLQEGNDLVEQARQLKDDADQALKDNETLEWEAHIQGGISEDDKTTFMNNVNTFIENTKQSVITQAQGIEEQVNSLIGGETGAALVSAIDQYSTEDLGTMDSLSSAIKGIAEDAVNAGLQDVDINAALSIAQAKLAQFNAGLQQAQMKSNLDYLGIEYSGAALDKDSWSKVIEEMDNYQKEYDESAATSEKSILSYFEQESALGHTDENGVFEGTNFTMDDITDIVAKARGQRQMTSQQLAQDWMNKSLSDAYGKEIEGADMQGEAQKRLDQILSTAQAGGDAFSTAETVGGTMNWNLDHATSGALADRYSQMMPNVQNMQDAIDKAREAGEAVPQAYMDAYNQAIEVGAAAGDTNAGYQYMANQLAEAGKSQEFLDQIDQAGAVIPQEFRDAIDRSMTQTTTEDYSSFYDTFMKGVSGELDWSAVEGELEKHGLSLGEDFWNGVQEGSPQSATDAAKYLNIDGLTQGATGTTEGGESVVSYTLDADVNTVWSVAGKVIEAGGGGGLGQNELTQKILEANGWSSESATSLDKGTTVNIPVEYVVDPTVDNSNVGQAVAEASSSAAGSASSTQTVSTTTQNEVTTETTVTNTGEAAQEVHDQTQAALDTPTDITGKANVTVSQSNNAAEVYDQVASDLRSAFNSAISLSANAVINMNWSISNASKTITLSGASGGSFTITAHKEGGYFTQPHVGIVAEAGPEWIIPDDGSQDSKEMMMEAARSILGSGYSGDKVAPDMAAYLGSGNGSGGTSSSKDINININGNGTIRASGMSREQVVEILQDNLRPVLLNIVSTEDAEEGMLAYEY